MRNEEEQPEDPAKDGANVDIGALKALPAFAVAGGLGLAALVPLLDHKTSADCRKEEHSKIMEKINDFNKKYSAHSLLREHLFPTIDFQLPLTHFRSPLSILSR